MVAAWGALASRMVFIGKGRTRSKMSKSCLQKEHFQIRASKFCRGRRPHLTFTCYSLFRIHSALVSA